MNSTFATAVISAEDLDEARIDFPEHFTAGYGASEDSSVTHYVASGFWFDDELTKLVNDVAWPRQVFFGDPKGALDTLGIVSVQDTSVPEVGTNVPE